MLACALSFEKNMILDFNKIEASVLPNFKGGEKALKAQMFFDGKVRIMMGELEQGASIGLHRHETNCEVIYVLSGEGRVLTDEGSEAVSAGEAHYCPMGAAHSLINDRPEPLRFFAVVPEQCLEKE